jgi:isocitrate dehydrogenase
MERNNKTSLITYTLTDESPALATRSLLPIVRAFASIAGISIETKDISLSSRVISVFSDFLTEDQRTSNALLELGELAKMPEANIVKTPNISASMTQLKAVIAELQSKGYALPDYPDQAETAVQNDIKARYDKIKGSAVNPVLREGNSDRRAPLAVKNYARKHPHAMGEWKADSASHVAYMKDGDFFHNERSLTIERACTCSIEFTDEQGNGHVLKDNIPLLEGEVVDATFMSKKKLEAFLMDEMADAKSRNLLFSIHLKATMMKVSDPIIFGHAVKAYFKPLFKKYRELFDELGIDARNGFAALLSKISELPSEKRLEIEKEINACFANGPFLAMVHSEKGITNLHVPSDVIVDASMPAMIRNSGRMWNAKGEAIDTKAVLPDSSYASIYQVMIDFCKKNGAFDPVTMGTVPNVGLMAKAAEEYGSHDKTFEITGNGKVRVTDGHGKIMFEHNVEKGDIWRMCQVKDEPIRDWVKLAVNRARLSQTPAVFWLNQDRAHDAELIKKVKQYLLEHDTNGLDIRILSLDDAIQFTMERIVKGLDTISVSGNVLRDYLTDLFPILEVGTSAKMLSIVPLMNGGGLFETGAGGSAPKHVEQFLEEGHLRWDSLGEFLALAASLEHLSIETGNQKAKLLAETLDQATGKWLEENKSPKRKAGELDNRGSHYYLTLYWTEALASQEQDQQLKDLFSSVFAYLHKHEAQILEEINASQGRPVDLGGYYKLDEEKANRVMRPSQTFNQALDMITNVRA